MNRFKADYRNLIEKIARSTKLIYSTYQEPLDFGTAAINGFTADCSKNN